MARREHGVRKRGYTYRLGQWPESNKYRTAKNTPGPSETRDPEAGLGSGNASVPSALEEQDGDQDEVDDDEEEEDEDEEGEENDEEKESGDDGEKNDEKGKGVKPQETDTLDGHFRGRGPKPTREEGTASGPTRAAWGACTDAKRPTDSTRHGAETVGPSWWPFQEQMAAVGTTTGRGFHARWVKEKDAADFYLAILAPSMAFHRFWAVFEQLENIQKKKLDGEGNAHDLAAPHIIPSTDMLNLLVAYSGLSIVGNTYTRQTLIQTLQVARHPALPLGLSWEGQPAPMDNGAEFLWDMMLLRMCDCDGEAEFQRHVETVVGSLLVGGWRRGEAVRRLAVLPRARQDSVGTVLDLAAYGLLQYCLKKHNACFANRYRAGHITADVMAASMLRVDDLLEQFVSQQTDGTRPRQVDGVPAQGPWSPAVAACVAWCAETLKTTPAGTYAATRSGRTGQLAIRRDAVQVFCSLWHLAFATHSLGKPSSRAAAATEARSYRGRGERPGTLLSAWTETALPELAISPTQLLLTVCSMLVDPIHRDHDENAAGPGPGRRIPPSFLTGATPIFSSSAAVSPLQRAAELRALDPPVLFRRFLHAYLGVREMADMRRLSADANAFDATEMSAFRALVIETLDLPAEWPSRQTASTEHAPDVNGSFSSVGQVRLAAY
jgi:hypothetical protein